MGLLKIANTVMPATLKTNAVGTLVDLPSTAPLPAHRLGTDLEFERAERLDHLQHAVLQRLEWGNLVGSNLGRLVCPDLRKRNQNRHQTDGTCIQADSLSADLHYIDSRFKQYLNGLRGVGQVTGVRPVAVLGRALRRQIFCNPSGGPDHHFELRSRPGDRERVPALAADLAQASTTS